VLSVGDGIARVYGLDNVQAGESAPRFYAAMRDAIAAHSADAARAKSLAESGTGPRFEHRA
jgi:F0F1-type ATP synthase alpha subunit